MYGNNLYANYVSDENTEASELKLVNSRGEFNGERR